ncbi:hypothetical protein BJ165DRAFT_1468515 [Panaeolus papilionaceus]|nr:hypothetical protein BJ165DRAFT_1468515 [Panaeolus papilionaceus]
MEQPPPPEFTLLRIKRKRNEDPLDALVVEPHHKHAKDSTSAGVFQYAQTVSIALWDNESQQRDIQERISRLVSQPIDAPTAQSGQAPANAHGHGSARRNRALLLRIRRQLQNCVNRAKRSQARLQTRPGGVRGRGLLMISSCQKYTSKPQSPNLSLIRYRYTSPSGCELWCVISVSVSAISVSVS